MSSIPPDHQACVCFIGNARAYLTRPVTTRPAPVSPCTIASAHLAELSCWLSVMCPPPRVTSIRSLVCPIQCDDSNCLAFASLLCKQVTYARVKTTCPDVSFSVHVTCCEVMTAEMAFPVQWDVWHLARAPPVGAPCVWPRAAAGLREQALPVHTLTHHASPRGSQSPPLVKPDSVGASAIRPTPPSQLLSPRLDPACQGALPAATPPHYGLGRSDP